MFDITNYELKMDSSIESFKGELSKIRSGRANPMMFNEVNMDYYGTPTPIAQIANVTTPEPRQLLVKPYDRSIIKDMTAAIRGANLGVDPVNEGEQIRISIPALTEENRKIYVKKAKEEAENARIAIRNIRRAANDEVKKSDDYTEDERKGELEDIQKLTDAKIAEVDSIEKNKENELMEI